MKTKILALASTLLFLPQVHAAKDPKTACTKSLTKKANKFNLANEFTSLSDDEVALKIIKAYPDIMALTGAVDASPFGITMAHPEKPLASEKIFNQSHPEFDRTIAGILVLKWFLTGNYEKLVSVQKPEVRLTRARFEQIRAYIQKVVPTPESLDAMITSMVINDLGKVKEISLKIKKDTGVNSVDHDIVLLAALSGKSSVSSSFNRLSAHYKTVIMKGLDAKFNLGQFVQAENVAASLDGMKSLVGDQESLDFFLVHALIDIAGVAGHKTQDGSMLLTEPLATSFYGGIEALRGFGEGKSSAQVFDAFLASKGRTFGLSIEQPQQKTAIRLATMLGLTNAKDASLVVQALNNLPPNTRAILNREMNLYGVKDGTAILIYYAPAVVSNIRAAIDKSGGQGLSSESLGVAFTTLARIYTNARIQLAGKTENGVYTVFAKSVAEAAGQDVKALAQKDLPIVNDSVELRDVKTISLDTLPRAQLKRAKVGLIGIGGGSDGVQAALLAQLLQGHGATPKFVISIRTAKAEGETRTVENHGGEIARGVYKILPSTKGSGRFLENLPANDVNMFIVTDYQDGTLLSQIQSVIQSVGGVEKVVAVDTGGDSLYSTVAANASRATPDQDLRVLMTLSQLNIPVESAVIAVGVDSPDNAEDILRKAKARYYEPTSNEAQAIVEKYRAWKMDGSSDSRFGKTSLAWQSALLEKHGMQTLPIPSRYVLNTNNPWNPYVRIAPSMSGIVFMDLADHLHAVGARSFPFEVVLSVAHQSFYIRSQSAVVDLVAYLVGKNRPQAMRIGESPAPFYPDHPMAFLRDNMEQARLELLKQFPWMKEVPRLSSPEQMNPLKKKYSDVLFVTHP